MTATEFRTSVTADLDIARINEKLRTFAAEISGYTLTGA